MTMLTRWNPLAKRNGTAVIPMERDFDRLFSEMDRAFRDVAMPAVGWSFETPVPAADVVETADAVTVRMDLPGHDAKDIHVNVENDVLTVRSERKTETQEKGETLHRCERSYGLYTRSFALPATVDAQKAEARYENGVLSVTLPKREDARPRAIAVHVKS
jgi:HSP20 family protein